MIKKEITSLFFIILIALLISPCSLDQYKDRSGAQLKVIFPTKAAKNRLLKPVGADENHVPVFVDRINLVFDGDTIDPIERNYVRDVTQEGLTNVFDIEGVPYGTYSVQVSAYTCNEDDPERCADTGILTHQAEGEVEIGGANENSGQTISLNKMSGTFLNGPRIGAVIFEQYDISKNFYRNYGADVDEDGKTALCWTENSTIDQYKRGIRLLTFDHKGAALIPPTNALSRDWGDDHINVNVDCSFFSSWILIPYLKLTNASGHNFYGIHIAKFSESAFIEDIAVKVSDLGGASSVMNIASDYSRDRFAVLWQESGSKSYLMVFDSDLNRIKPEPVEICTGCINPQLKFIDDSNIVITYLIEAQNSIRELIYDKDGNYKDSLVMNTVISGFYHSISSSFVSDYLLMYANAFSGNFEWYIKNDLFQRLSPEVNLKLGSDALSNVLDPYIESYEASKYIAFYSAITDTTNDIYYSLIDTDTEFAPEVEMDISPSNNLLVPIASANSDGYTVVFYRSFDIDHSSSDPIQIFFKRYLF